VSAQEKYLSQLAEKIIKLARKKNVSICTVESCTGGLISSTLVSISGASNIFKGSLVCYDSKVKIKILGVPKNIVEKNFAASEKCALSMSKKAAEFFDCDYALASTGFAEKGKEIFLSLYSKSEHFAEKHFFEGERNKMRENATKKSLEVLLDAIKNS